ncbi:MAG: hypothetical protein JNM62_06720 [Flavobacteriales bacterium]|nr:hypothetical protein [Flavobacteriales bacterium]
MDQRNGQEGKGEDKLKPLFVLMAIVLVVWSASWIAIVYVEDEAVIRGQFGDMFGAVNSLFSGLAFAGIIYTILLQRRELGLQRRELESTRKELERSANAQEEVKAEMLRQATIQSKAARVQALSVLINHLDRYEEMINRGEGGEVLRHPAYERDQHIQSLKREMVSLAQL